MNICKADVSILSHLRKKSVRLLRERLRKGTVTDCVSTKIESAFIQNSSSTTVFEGSQTELSGSSLRSYRQ